MKKKGIIMKIPFKGCATAIVTPMKGGAVDYGCLEGLVDRQIEAGVSALVPCGTTGEASTLCREEKRRIIECTVKSAAGRVPVVAGCASTSTAIAASLARDAQEAGAAAVLCLTPYYNRASEEGVYLHFKEVCESVCVPVIAYNVPKRTGVCIDTDTYERLCTIENFAGVKEASGNAGYVSRIAWRAGERMAIYSGSDELTAPLYALGASGVISVLSNIVPERMVELCRLCETGSVWEAARAQIALLPLAEALFSEVNPIPVKTALAKMGLCTDEMRLPLCKMKPDKAEKLFEVMRGMGLIG